jgi:hypothetical protein
MRRSTKYLNAREYAERLFMSDNRDVQDFAKDFLDALDDLDGGKVMEIKAAIDAESEIFPEDTKTYPDKIEWMVTEAGALGAIEESIAEACPGYADKIDDGDIEEVIADMLKRLRPVQEYDL